jgi:hypothetical protein
MLPSKVVLTLLLLVARFQPVSRFLFQRGSNLSAVFSQLWVSTSLLCLPVAGLCAIAMLL